MDLQLKDKIILVSGGAKGIGEGIVRLLAAESAIPVIIGRNKNDNEKLLTSVRSSGHRAWALTAELSKPEDSAAAIATVLAEFGRIDGVVNNAGLNDGVGLDDSGGYDNFMRSLHRNVVHYYLLVHHALPALIKSHGSIVNISSKTGETGQGGNSGYAAANGARNALTREWALDLLKYQIRVNAVVVSECWTPQYENWIKTLSHPEEKLAEITSKIPLGKRMTTTEEIANTVAFLLSERSSHTTGQLIHVDGGYVHLDRSLIKA